MSDSLRSLNWSTTAEEIVCAYPISDIYGPSPRYLYYALLALIFLFTRQRWLSKVCLGAASAYAASAALHAFIIVSAPGRLAAAQNVTVPPRLSLDPARVNASYEKRNNVVVQPDALDLDLDAITAIVVTACLVGLPLQIWSRTVRSSNMIYYLVLVWNAIMLAATISVLIAWPTTNTAPIQYRFCYEPFQDDSPVSNDGWDKSLWRGNWNATVWNIFTNPDTIWGNLSTSCFYPCFSTHEIIRPQTSLKASTSGLKAKFAKLHDPEKYDDYVFQPLVYFILCAFGFIDIYLLVVAGLGLCSDFVPINEPARLWRDRKLIKAGFRAAFSKHWHFYSRLRRFVLRQKSPVLTKEMQCHLDRPHRRDAHVFLRLCVDVMTVLLLIISLTLFPIAVVGFIVWIEWYIENDGTPTENPRQVGQWSPLVSVAVVTIAAGLYQFKNKVAGEEELRREIEHSEQSLNKLKKLLIAKVGDDSEIASP